MRKILVLLAAAACGTTLWAASGGSEGSAITITAGKSKEVTLVKDAGEFAVENGVCYLRMTLLKGEAYTVWIEGGDAEAIGSEGFDAYPYENWGDAWDDDFEDFDFDAKDFMSDDDDWGDDWIFAPAAAFAGAAARDGKVADWLYADTWAANDPPSWTYYIKLSGEIGQKTTVHVEKRICTFLPAGAVKLAPVPGSASSVLATEGAVSEPCDLDTNLNSRAFCIYGRAGVTYRVGTTFTVAATATALSASVTKLYGGRSTAVPSSGADLTPGKEISFTADENGIYCIEAKVADPAVDYPPFVVHSLGYAADGSALGLLQVNVKGNAGNWTLDSEPDVYSGGESLLLTGSHTVTFAAITGFSVTADPDTGSGAKGIWSGDVVPGRMPTVVTGVYNDIYDPKDNVMSGATKLKLSYTVTEYDRTLWKEDPEDWFSFTAKDGNYYDLVLSKVTGDAVLTLTDANGAPLVSGVPSISRMAIGKGNYYVCVSHRNPSASEDGTYTLVAQSANAGSIKFSKTDVKAKDTAGKVKLSVARTAKEGRMRVRYATVDGSARAGDRYVAQSGILEWAAGDNKAKTIEIKIIPPLVSVKSEAPQFAVVLSPIEDAELENDEYKAQILAGTCTVTLTSTGKANTIAETYAKTAPKQATVKTEVVPLRSGTFFGVVSETGGKLVTGLPQLASVTLTVTAKADKPDTLSAKVALAGKTYTFKTSKEPEQWEDLGDGRKRITLTLVQKINKVDYTDTMTIVIRDGATDDGASWSTAVADITLLMNVPDVKGTGFQADILYTGEIYRQNAKIQDYLTKMQNFVGYYTVALAPEGVTSADGVPAGNGYLTLKIDNKGGVKVAGLLADNTKVSLSAKAVALIADPESKLGYSLYVPVFLAKSPYCFGGTIRLYAREGVTTVDPAKSGYEIVVDSKVALVWNNDDANQTRSGVAGWRIPCDPVGGWYDTVVNLERYYLDSGIRSGKVGSAELTEFPTEVLPAGYAFDTTVAPNLYPVDFLNNTFTTPKKQLVKSGGRTDLENSVNPCNVQVKLARATGIVTGSFSLWGVTDAGAQKEITGAKHYGIVLLSRDPCATLAENVLSAGFSLQTVKHPKADGKGTRSWKCSLPFNILDVPVAPEGEQGEVQQ